MLNSLNECVYDSSSCTNGTCTDCGVATNYYLTGNSTCLPCPNISNCLQCDGSSLYACQLCALGYFINSDYLCEACPAGCVSCISPSLCDTCKRGYTIPIITEMSACEPCRLPCLTCMNGVSLCLECAPGFTKRNWKCQNDIFLQFKVVFRTGTVDDINSIAASLVFRILQIMGQNTDNTDLVTIEVIDTGSTVVAGTYDEGTTTTSDTVV